MPAPVAITVVTLNDAADADSMNRVYVRCGMVHLGAHLKVDVVNETPQTTVLTVVVDDGALHIALNRRAAQSLQQKLELFIKDWPDTI